jgi:hypothetical protein
MKGTKKCVLPHCRAQTETETGKSGAFFQLPGLKRYPELRKIVVESVGLPEVYMRDETKAVLCWRHYRPCDFDTTGQRLRLKPGILLFILNGAKKNRVIEFKEPLLTDGLWQYHPKWKQPKLKFSTFFCLPGNTNYPYLPLRTIDPTDTCSHPK